MSRRSIARRPSQGSSMQGLAELRNYSHLLLRPL
ncbi:hypothetical protein E2C01_091676 [Portunus trituberculatus]|uniref:Uncharacterized protein n=1 Tax=Portunus trituberculatus TaxID=210409 RepID=A0A5B7JTJ8_PORTR|nr:hypothetical protein [Portunus trituberculatus]